MKFKILTIILIMALGNMVFADDISDVLNKEKNRLSGNTQETTIKQEKAQETTTIKQVETTIREIAKEETTKITETTKETIPKKNNIANKDETTDAYVQNMEIYDGMEFSDLIAEEVIYLNNAKYDYSMFIRILNVDKDTSFIINDGETILNAYSSLKDINEYITRYDFVVFSKYNRKSNSVNVRVLKDNNVSGTLTINPTIKDDNIVKEENTTSYIAPKSIATSSVASRSYIYRKSTNSTIKTTALSTKSETNYYNIKKITGIKISTISFTNGVDEFGNKIENSVNSWVGEDNGEIDNNITKNIDNIDGYEIDKENSGLINVNIDDSLELGNSNIKIILIDNTYTLWNLFIYYQNNYNEKMYLPLGKYKVNDIVNLNSEIQDLKTSLREFTITKDENVELTITRKDAITIKPTITPATISTISQIVEKKPSKIFTILKLIIIILIIVGLGFVAKKIIANRFDYE